MDGCQSREQQKGISLPSLWPSPNLSKTKPNEIQDSIYNVKLIVLAISDENQTSETPLTAKEDTPEATAVEMSWGALLMILGSWRWQCASNSFIFSDRFVMFLLGSTSQIQYLFFFFFFPVFLYKFYIHPNTIYLINNSVITIEYLLLSHFEWPNRV